MSLENDGSVMNDVSQSTEDAAPQADKGTSNNSTKSGSDGSRPMERKETGKKSQQCCLHRDKVRFVK